MHTHSHTQDGWAYNVAMYKMRWDHTTPGLLSCTAAADGIEPSLAVLGSELRSLLLCVCICILASASSLFAWDGSLLPLLLLLLLLLLLRCARGATASDSLDSAVVAVSACADARAAGSMGWDCGSSKSWDVYARIQECRAWHLELSEEVRAWHLEQAR